MNVSSVNNRLYTFGSTQNKAVSKKDENPISATGEKALLAKSAFAAGAVMGGKLLLELCDDGFLFDKFGDASKKIASKQKNLTKTQRVLKQAGIFAGLTALFVVGFAALYTLFKAPSINYNGNVNAFKKGKDMDVYIKGNETEKELYTQMNEKAKNANKEEKQKLREQYMQMQVAKNQVPKFVNMA